MAGIGSGVGEEFFEVADALPDDDEAAAVAVGEGFEEDAVDDAEEGGGGSYAEGEGEDGGEGEAGGLAELAQAVANVLEEECMRFYLFVGRLCFSTFGAMGRGVGGRFFQGFCGYSFRGVDGLSGIDHGCSEMNGCWGSAGANS